MNRSKNQGIPNKPHSHIGQTKHAHGTCLVTISNEADACGKLKAKKTSEFSLSLTEKKYNVPDEEIQEHTSGEVCLTENMKDEVMKQRRHENLKNEFIKVRNSAW